MERRKPGSTKPSPLPTDYLKLVTEVFTTNFDAGLKKMEESRLGTFFFDASGGIYLDEVVLCVALHQKGKLAATSVYASADFDPKASAPNAQDVLAACVDALGTLYSQILDAENPDRLSQLADESLSALEDVPYDWTAMNVERLQIHLKVDKANPGLDSMADDFLAKNDPEFLEREAEDQKKTEDLFVTGDKAKKPGGSVH